MTSTRPFTAPFPAATARPDPCSGSAFASASIVVRTPDARRRTGPALALALLLASTAAGAQSQGVYRHVMPDGKVVYSDRADEGTGQSTRLIAPQIRAATPTTDAAKGQAEAKTPETKAAEEVAARLRTAKAAAKPAPREPAAGSAPASQIANAPVAAPPDTALVQALMGVLGRADLLKRFSDTCSRTLPTSMGRYLDAAEGWQRRNGDTVGQAGRILEGGMRPEYAQVISSEVKRIGDREFAQVSSASMHQRIKWCDNGVDEIKAGKLDVFNNASLTRPLTSFGKS